MATNDLGTLKALMAEMKSWSRVPGLRRLQVGSIVLEFGDDEMTATLELPTEANAPGHDLELLEPDEMRTLRAVGPMTGFRPRERKEPTK